MGGSWSGSTGRQDSTLMHTNKLHISHSIFVRVSIFQVRELSTSSQMEKSFNLESVDPELFKRAHAAKFQEGAERQKIIGDLKGSDLDLKAAAENGFKARSTVGQNFSRSSAGRGDAYKNLGSREAKAQFRNTWAKTQFEGLISSKIRHTIIKESWKTRAQYLPFFKIVEKERGKLKNYNNNNNPTFKLKHFLILF